jgi:class 3 adenylate cyclase
MPHSDDNRSQDDNCSQSSATEVGGHTPEVKEETLAKNETRAVAWLRLLVLCVLLAVTLAVSISVYFYSHGNEESEFELAIEDHASKIVSAFQENADRRLGAIESFAVGVTSHAMFSNSTWPNVTVPDFEIRGAISRKLADVISLQVWPIVTTETRAGWRHYSVDNQGWLEEGIEIQQFKQKLDSNDTNLADQQASLEGLNATGTYDVPTDIWRGDDELGRVPADGPGPFLPMWQMSPSMEWADIVNYDAFDHDTLKDPLASIMKTSEPTVGSSWDYVDGDNGRLYVMNLFLNHGWGGAAYLNDPVSDVYYPVFDSFADDKTMVAIVMCQIYWRTYLTDILPQNVRGVIVVLANTCNQTFTYQLDGQDVTYLGRGDHHDPKYNHLGTSTEFGAIFDTSADTSGACLYALHVYPSQTLEDDHLSSTPLIFTIVLVCVFIFTSLVFVTYDRMVGRRHKVVNQTAVQSSAIINTLFPEKVRERLYQEDEDKRSKEESQTGFKTFLSDAPRSFPGEGNGSDYQGPPIAHLNTDCTVLFADISGFTSWSSERSPTEVFTLLETLYGAFDRIAKRRRVFKVETIGDCYVAVTGLPDPQSDHAITMCRFAIDCMKQMKVTIGELQHTLGPETSMLSMRFGLHSGPVTSGVLRGDKSRFQLFGDTVNTAARMESTGQRDRIQVSQSTADLLIASGRSDWINKRDGLVAAKGKGELQTYWLVGRTTSAGSTYTAVTVDAMMSDEVSSTKDHESDVRVGDTLNSSGPIDEHDDAQASSMNEQVTSTTDHEADARVRDTLNSSRPIEADGTVYDNAQASSMGMLFI